MIHSARKYLSFIVGFFFSLRLQVLASKILQVKFLRRNTVAQSLFSHSKETMCRVANQAWWCGVCVFFLHLCRFSGGSLMFPWRSFTVSLEGSLEVLQRFSFRCCGGFSWRFSAGASQLLLQSTRAFARCSPHAF